MNQDNYNSMKFIELYMNGSLKKMNKNKVLDLIFESQILKNNSVQVCVHYNLHIRFCCFRK